MSRLLTIGVALPNYLIDNYNVFTAPSYFDYDWLAIDPYSITDNARDLVEGTRTFEAFDGRPVVNGATTAHAVSAAEQVKRRGEETQRLLDAGGVVFVFARPNATYAGLIGFEGCDRYSWLPAPAGISWGPPLMRPAEGKTVRVADEDHPVSGILRDYRNEFSYRAIFDDRSAPFREAGRVLARGGAGTPIAVEFSVLSGKVIFLPVLGESYGNTRTEVAERILDVCRHLSGVGLPSERPHWANSVAVPGIEPLETALREAEAAAETARREIAESQEHYAGLDHHRSLLWEAGPVLASEVQQALRQLGFEVTANPDEPVLVSSEGKTVALEVEGSRDQVVEWPYVRLQRRLEERLLKTGSAPGGLIVVNGHRTQAPESRGQQYTDALKNACENYRYTLVTTETLFWMVVATLNGATDADLLGFRRRLFATSGPFSLETPEPTESKPLF